MRSDMTGTALDGATGIPEPAITHQSLVFLLSDDARVRSIERDRYVALGRGEASVREFTSRRFVLGRLLRALSTVDGTRSSTRPAAGWCSTLSARSICTRPVRSPEAFPQEAQ